jgi:hypothetical protein
MGLYAKRCLLYLSGTLPCIQYKGKGRGYYLYGWVALLSGADAGESRDGSEKMEIRNVTSHLLRVGICVFCIASFVI